MMDIQIHEIKLIKDFKGGFAQGNNFRTKYA